MKRPIVPVWSHQHSVWVYNGASFVKGVDADYRYTLDLQDYCDYLENKMNRFLWVIREVLEDD